MKNDKKYLILLFILLAFAFNTCTEEEIFFTPDDGTYEGIFTIVESDNSTQSGQVTFTFSNNNIYSCSPEKRYLPPTGGGDFHISKNKILLDDKIIHPADFDWTLILNGEFVFTYDGVKLILTQNDILFNRFRKIELIKQD